MRNIRPLLWTRKIGLGMAAVMVGVLGLTMVPRADATAITFYDNAGTLTTQRFTLGCGSATGSCVGKLEAVSDTSPLAWSSTVGQMLSGPSNASPVHETSFVNGLLGTNLTASSGNITPANGNPFEFSLDADYFLIKVGNGPTGQGYALLQNLDGNLDLWFTATGQGGGLSHYITFGGGATPVPEPAALGMFGTGVLLIGLFVGLRRRYF